MSLVRRRLSFLTLVRLLLFFVINSVNGFLYAQSIDIKLIDGRNGQPIAKTCVNVWIGDEQKNPLAIPTDPNGVARLELTKNEGEVNIQNSWKNCGDFGVINPVVKYKDFIKINVGYVICESQGSDFSWLAVSKVPTRTLLQKGIVTPNTCGKANASPRPGELIIFVRPLNFWEKIKQ